MQPIEGFWSVEISSPFNNELSTKLISSPVTGISFPGEAKGILRNVNQWSDRSIIGVPIGYEVGVTALQMIMAYSAIANGGYLLKPIIVDQIIS